MAVSDRPDGGGTQVRSSGSKETQGFFVLGDTWIIVACGGRCPRHRKVLKEV